MSQRGEGEEAKELGADSVLLYQTEDGQVQLQVRLDDDTVWLSQAQLGDLLDSSKQNIGQHVRHVFSEVELIEEAVVKGFFTTASDGKRYKVRHYSLDVIISVGYRVKSLRGTQFRIWATGVLRDYLVKGFALDDKRLKENTARDRYFDELVERIRDIRTSERQFYRKVADIYATSIDYDRKGDLTAKFYATVQNKFHFAITGQTAAELIDGRADSDQPNDREILTHLGKVTKEAADAKALAEYRKFRDAQALPIDYQSDFDRTLGQLKAGRTAEGESR